MSFIKPIAGDDYPTLPFKVQQAGYTVTNCNDFTATSYNGAPSRLNAGFLNGWKKAKLTILFKDMIEQSVWDAFYRKPFSGKTGGLNNGVVPFFAECQLAGEVGLFLCQLVKAEFQTSNIRGFTAQMTLDVEVNPESFSPDAQCKREVLEGMIACGASVDEIRYTLNEIKPTVEDGMNPINLW